MNKKLSYLIPLKIFPAEILFSFNETDKELIRTIKSIGFGNDAPVETLKLCDSCFGRCVKFQNGLVVLRLRDFPESSTDFGRLQHEIFHAVYFVLHDIDVTLSVESNEVFAYLTQYLTEEIYEKIANEEKRANTRRPRRSSNKSSKK